jgi:hypothetical protein
MVSVSSRLEIEGMGNGMSSALRFYSVKSVKNS